VRQVTKAPAAGIYRNMSMSTSMIKFHHACQTTVRRAGLPRVILRFCQHLWHQHQAKDCFRGCSRLIWAFRTLQYEWLMLVRLKVNN